MHRVRGCVLLIIAGCLFAAGCREISPVVSETPINGYGIRGRLSDKLGTPIAHAGVELTYTLDLVDTVASTQSTYRVEGGAQHVVVRIVNAAGGVVRTLVDSVQPAGVYSIKWDFKDSVRTLAVPGAYECRIFVNGGQRTFPLLVSGSVAAQTNLDGEFVIAPTMLPVGLFPIEYYNRDSTRYFGRASVSDYVYLLFTAPGIRYEVGVELKKNIEKRVDVIVP